MELRYRRETLVGLFLVVATLIFVFGMLWLRGKSLSSGRMVQTTFTDVSGLKVGDPIHTSGVTVGDIKEIRLVKPGQVLVTMELKTGQMPRRDARAEVRSLDFFGARFLDYDPGTSPDPQPANGVIPGGREDDLGETMQALATPGRRVLANAEQFLSPENATQLRLLLHDARVAVAQLGTAAQAPSREAASALVSLRELLQRLDLLVGSSAAQQTVENMRDASRNLAQVTATLQRTSSSLDSILLKVNRGRGSVGRLVNDTTLVTDLHEATAALTALLVDVKANPKHYINVHVF